MFVVLTKMTQDAPFYSSFYSQWSVCFALAQPTRFLAFGLQEIDELVADWNPEALTVPLDAKTQHELDSVPVVVGQNGPKPIIRDNGQVMNLSSLNFTGLSGNARMKERGIAALRQYAVGSCGPMQFYGAVGT